MTLGDAAGKPPTGAAQPGRGAAHPNSGVQPRPPQVVDESKLQDLVDHVGRTAAATFGSDFLALLQGRLTQVQTALGSADPEPALDAVLSLKASSAMVGAEHLTRYCTGLEKELREGRIPNADALPRIAADLRPALTDVLASMPPDADG